MINISIVLSENILKQCDNLVYVVIIIKESLKNGQIKNLKMHAVAKYANKSFFQM